MASAEPPPVVAVHYADPWCVWTWGLEPALRRVEAVFGPAVRVDYRIAGAIEHIAEWRRKMELEGPALIDWLKESMARTGNPADPECLAKESFSSSFGACLAVTAAQRLDPVRAPHYLRRLMEYLQVRGLPADARVLSQAAHDVGMDAARLKKSWGDSAVRATFDATRAEMRSAHRTFLQVEYVGAGGERVLVDEEFRSGPHEAAVEAVAPGLHRAEPGSPAEYFRSRGDLISIREVAEVFGWTDAEADEQLSAMWKRGEVERWTYGGAPFWTAVRRPAKSAPH